MLFDDKANFSTFRDCLFVAIVEKSSKPIYSTDRKAHTKRTRQKGRVLSLDTSRQQKQDDHVEESFNQDPAELSEFVEYLAAEIFPSLPQDLQTLSFHALKQEPDLAERYSLPLSQPTIETLLAPFPPTVPDTLLTYRLITPPTTDLSTFFNPVLTSLITTLTAKPPPPSTTRASECEICARDWITLTYHHLIPRQVHAKALKRGWHEEHVLNSVAWLCRACHSFVHRMAGNEELAREYWTVERILGREDVQRWAGWVGGVRWKKK